jgi:hypothetical protein
VPIQPYRVEIFLGLAVLLTAACRGLALLSREGRKWYVLRHRDGNGNGPQRLGWVSAGRSSTGGRPAQADRRGVGLPPWEA